MKRAVNQAMAVTFVLAAVLQFNDPDAMVWVFIYGLAALACGLWHVGRLRAWVAALWGCAAMVGALFLLSTIPEDLNLWSALLDWSMVQTGSESMRESGGLLWIACWMMALALWTE